MISYQIPAYRVQGNTVLFFAGWKRHFSLYPASDALVEKAHTKAKAAAQTAAKAVRKR